MPVTLGEEHSPCMKILSLLNADSEVRNEFWFTRGSEPRYDGSACT